MAGTLGPRAQTGRRPGMSGTREAIIAAARAAFSEHGYDRTTLRAIAQAAGVDPALIVHYFGSKQALFVEAVQLPFDPSVILPELLAGERCTVGERLAQFLIATMENRESRAHIVGLVRAAATDDIAARRLRRLIEEELYAPLADALGTSDAALRAGLLGAQVVGLVMARYVVAVEPLASTPPDRLVRILAPVLQRLLVDPA